MDRMQKALINKPVKYSQPTFFISGYKDMTGTNFQCTYGDNFFVTNPQFTGRSKKSIEGAIKECLDGFEERFNGKKQSK